MLGPEAKIVFSALTIVGIVGILLFVASFPLKNIKALKRYQSFIRSHGSSFALAAALLATLGSLFFSEIAGYEPCKLCWFQRIFMYPIAVMLIVAAWKKYDDVKRYALPLAIIGAPISLYHYWLHIKSHFFGIVTACSATGPSCAVSPSYTFGFVTIPLMAFVAFLVIILGLYFQLGKISSKKKKA